MEHGAKCHRLTGGEPKWQRDKLRAEITALEGKLTSAIAALPSADASTAMQASIADMGKQLTALKAQLEALGQQNPQETADSE